MLKVLLLHLAALASLASAGPARAAEEMLPDALLYPGERPGHILVVDKADQMLYLYSHDGAGNITLDRVLRCSTGQNLGDKMVEGDKKTPNGFYIFNQKLLPRELAPMYGTLAYPTDYPNFWDRQQGRGGSGIWLHGTNKPMIDNDSSGCTALENADIAGLEDLLRLYDTPIINYETLTLAPVEELRREGLAVKAFLEDWRRAWSGKDHAAYRAKYAPDFVNSDNRTFEGWMTHKENVAGNYREIRVELRDLRIYRHREVIVASFEQDYKGDQRFASVGLKRLYLRSEGGGYRIIGETFRPRPGFDDRKRLTPEEKRLALTTPPKVAPPVTAEPESSRVAVEARAAAEDQARLGPAGEALSEEGLPVAEARGSLPAVPEPAEPAPTEEARPEPPGPAPTEPPPPEPAPAEPAPLEPAPAEPAPPEPAPAEPAPTEPPVEQAAVQPPRSRAAEQAHFFAELVGQWARAWALKDQQAYFAFYHPDFYYKAMDMNLAAFKVYRSGLMEETGLLEVRVSDFEVQNWSGGRVRVAFRQDYRSDRLRDLGRKTLIFKQDGSDWKILSETWRTY